MKYLITICLITLSHFGFGQTEKFKALFMYKFLQGIEWPSNKAEGKYVVAVLGDQGVLDNMKALTNGRKVNGKAMEVVNYTPGTSMSGINMLFVAHKKRDLFESLQRDAIASSTVLVTESPGLASQGSFLNFIFTQGKLKFEMNKKTFDESNLKVSAAISSLAINVTN